MANQQLETMWTALCAIARDRPTKLAFRCLDSSLDERESVTYEELVERVTFRASILISNNLGGQRVILVQRTSIDFIVNIFAIFATGGTAIPLNQRVMRRLEDDLSLIVADAKPAVILIDIATMQRISNMNSQSLAIPICAFANEELITDRPLCQVSGNIPTNDNIALVQYTSGSTANPKGACITHDNLISNARMLTQRFAAGPADVVVSWLPLFHDMGLMTGLIWPVVAGASSVLLEPSTFSARPITWLRALSKYRATVSSGPNFAFQFCLDRVTDDEVAGLDLSSWRVAICGAEPVQGSTVRNFCERYAKVGFNRRALFPSYGLAEATLFATGGPELSGPRTFKVDTSSLEQKAEVKPPIDGQPHTELVACGLPADGLQIIIVNTATLAPAPHGSVGEIWISGPTVCRGYLGIDNEKGGLFANFPPDKLPFLRTGDLGVFDHGELVIVGRIKDILIVRGVKFAPQDIESTCARSHEALLGLNGVAFTADDKGDSLVVLHEIRRGFDNQVDDIIDCIRGQIARTHGISVQTIGLLPRYTLPLTSSGKIRRQPTRNAWNNGEINARAKWVNEQSRAVFGFA